jgi:hypothetical protein
MNDVAPPQQPRHAFNHAPAALRIFRFAADTAPRLLEIARVSAFLRECAVEFGSADATLPGALRNEHAAKRFFKLRTVVKRTAARCPWLAEKLLACRSGAPMPAAALAPDVTRHDVNWGAEGARRRAELLLTHGGFGLTLRAADERFWAQGPAGATSGKHYFAVCVTPPGAGNIMVGWADDKLVGRAGEPKDGGVGFAGTRSAGAAFCLYGMFTFGTAPLAADSYIDARSTVRECVLGCLLDLAATPARMTVFVDGEPLATQCEYDFPKDGRAWFPSVSLYDGFTAVHSCAV